MCWPGSKASAMGSVMWFSVEGQQGGGVVCWGWVSCAASSSSSSSSSSIGMVVKCRQTFARTRFCGRCFCSSVGGGGVMMSSVLDIDVREEAMEARGVDSREDQVEEMVEAEEPEEEDEAEDREEEDDSAEEDEATL